LDGWGRPVSSLAQAKQLADIDQALVLVGETIRFDFVDLGPEGFSAGDTFFFEERLYNRSQTKVVGKLSVRCQEGVRTRICDPHYRLKDRGKIVASAALFTPRDLTLAVTGGTNKFKAVGGVLQVYDAPGRKSLYVFKLVR
jgi:hypothetical protein